MSYLYIFLISCLTTFSSLACEESGTTRFRNSDNSVGGLVGPSVKIHPSAYISFNAKVCENAWVDANAKILDNAIVRGNAWIREFATIKDNAVVSDKAVAWGTRNAPVAISGNAIVFGYAKIMTGTSVSGDAKVYGEVKLKDSTISGNGEVCGNYQLNNQIIEDNYFCSSANSTSRAVLDVSNFKNKEFNAFNTTLDINSTLEFSSDKSVFFASINDTQLPLDDIQIYRNRISLRVLDHLVEGNNILVFSGKDIFGKDFKYSYEFIAGSNVKNVYLNRNTKIISDVVAIVDGVEFKVKSQSSNGYLIIKNLPADNISAEIRIKAYDNNGFYFNTFESITDIPDNLIFTEAPSFIDNVLDFSQGLSSWNVSKPENTEISNEGSAIIQFDPTDNVEISKTFKVPSSQNAIELKVSPASFKTMFDIGYKFQVIALNQTKGEIDVREFTLSELDSYSLSNDGVMTLPFAKITGEEEQISITLRLLANPIDMKESRYLKFPGLGWRWANVNFAPKNFSATNLQKNDVPNRVVVPDSIPLIASKCNVSSYNLGGRPLVFQAEMSDMTFFSVGPSDSMPEYRENRIYGNISIPNIPKKYVRDNVRIVISQGSRVVSDTLSVCALEAFKSIPSNSEMSLTASSNLVKPLFAIPSWVFNNFETTPGQRVFLRVDVQVLTTNGWEWVKGDVKPLKVLSSPFTSSGFTYGIVDYYDRSEYNLTRTGGDKWILPTYAEKLMTIMNLFYVSEFNIAKWRFDDLSKMHGGYFPPHGTLTHIDGRDADVRFAPYTYNGKEILFDFNELGSDEDRWKSVLYEIENFLKKIELQYDYIQDIYITRSGYSTRFLNTRFANRCFNNQRYIQFERGNQRGSLMRHVDDHHNHLHIRFHPVDVNGNAIAKDKGETPQNDISELWFKLGSDGNKLEIFPAEDSVFAKKYIAWRFQDVSGFEDVDMNLEIGGWPYVTPWSSSSLFEKRSKSAKRFIYVTIANRGGGGCVQREVEIEPNKIKKNTLWTYKKRGNSFHIVYKDLQ